MTVQSGGYADRRVLVLGASGFIGRWVSRVLAAEGAHVYLAVRDAVFAREVFGQYGVVGSVQTTSLSTEEEIDAIFAAARPSVTFNLAGYGVDRQECDELESFRINERILPWIVEAAARHSDPYWSAMQVVHAGSALEYGMTTGHLDEDGPAHPTTLYGRSKLAGTRALAEAAARHGVRAITARLFTVYGPGEHAGRLLPSLLAAARRGSRVQLSSGQQKRDFTYVEDVSSGLLRLGLLTAPAASVVNLATGRLHSVRRFAEIAAGVLGLPAGALHFGALPSRPDDMVHDEVTVDRLRNLTGWVPTTSIEAGVRQTWMFHRSAHVS